MDLTVERYKEILNSYRNEDGFYEVGIFTAKRNAKEQRISELLDELDAPELYNVALKLDNITKILKLMNGRSK
jgi:hypothetical protein